jgi:hypothetical protein
LTLGEYKANTVLREEKGRAGLAPKEKVLLDGKFAAVAEVVDLVGEQDVDA